MIRGKAALAALAVLLAALAVVLAAALLTRPQSAQQAPPVQAASTLPAIYLFMHPQPAPSLEVTSLDGKRISLAALRGKVVLLNFWATWCGPCREEIPALEKLQKAYAGQLQVIGMSVDELPPAAVEKTAERMGINYPVGLASPELQSKFGGFPTIPVTWVIDRNGQVEQKNHGANPYEIFDAEVRTLLGLPTTVHVARVDQLSPNGKVGTIDIPGIAADLRALTPTQREAALDKLNNQACTCGCDWSLATCRVQDPNCGFSLPQARQAIAAIKNKR